MTINAKPSDDNADIVTAAVSPRARRVNRYDNAAQFRGNRQAQAINPRHYLAVWCRAVFQ